MVSIISAYKKLVEDSPTVAKLTIDEFTDIFDNKNIGTKGIFRQMADLMQSISMVERKDPRRTPLSFQIPFWGTFFATRTRSFLMYSQSLGVYRMEVRNLNELVKTKAEKSLIAEKKKEIAELSAVLRLTLEYAIDAADYKVYKSCITQKSQKSKRGNGDFTWDWEKDEKMKWEGILSGNVPRKHFDFFLDNIFEPEFDLDIFMAKVRAYQVKNKDFFLLHSWFLILKELINFCYKKKQTKKMFYFDFKEILEKGGVKFIYYGEFIG